MAATAETIIGCIERRMGREKMAALREKYGDRDVDDALYMAGSFHAGCEEIGSSDVYYMTRSFLRNLGEDV